MKITANIYRILTCVTIAGTTLFPSTFVFAETPSEDIKLPVPFFHQQHSLSCEAVALRMALAYQGVQVSENTLISQLAYDLTPKYKGVWGDPQKGFVGSISGKMLVTGYGVYIKPLEALADRYTHTQEIEDATLSDIAFYTSQKIPVVVWGYYATSSGKNYSWRTPTGATVHAVAGEHARVAVGFKGTISDPEGFYLIDPITGLGYWPKDQFKKNWASLGNMALAVFPTQ